MRVGFAAETERVEPEARRKLAAKRADLIVANDVSGVEIGFDSDENEVQVYSAEGLELAVERTAKAEIARRLLDLCERHLASRSASTAVPDGKASGR
jgi:phosphopantothenoylcysteine decarboxylase/phosphopantothenate--cysteine ligase